MISLLAAWISWTLFSYRWVGGAFEVATVMLGLRSVYSVNVAFASSVQLRRLERDQWYMRSHSRVGMKFIEVPFRLAATVKHMAAARVLHDARDACGLSFRLILWSVGFPVRLAGWPYHY